MDYINERKLSKLQDYLPTVISDIGKPDMSIPTGIASLDDKMNGLYPSDLIVIGGRPSMGKSSLLTDIALHISRNRHVLIFNEAMPVGILISGLPISDITVGKRSCNLHSLRSFIYSISLHQKIHLGISDTYQRVQILFGFYHF